MAGQGWSRVGRKVWSNIHFIIPLLAVSGWGIFLTLLEQFLPDGWIANLIKVALTIAAGGLVYLYLSTGAKAVRKVKAQQEQQVAENFERELLEEEEREKAKQAEKEAKSKAKRR